MYYKSLEWAECGTEDNPEKKTYFSGYRLLVSLDENPNIIDDNGWSYAVLDSNNVECLSGYHFATEEQAMHEAIFDAMVLRLRDSN